LAKEQALYDKNRTSDLESMSIKELRFENVQVLNHLGKVLAIILEQLAYNKSDE
jgi:very-short-patch-repair endonuclease